LQNMIQKIIEADSKAKQLEQENRKAAEDEKQRIEEEAETIYREYMEKAQEEITKNDEYLEKKYERNLSDVTAKQESALIRMRADFEQNRDRWADEIVSRVLGQGAV